MEQAIINVEGTTTIETAAAAKKLIEMFGNQNVRAISVNRVNDKSDEVIVELDFVPGLVPHLHGFTLQVNGLTCGYAGTGPSNLYEVLQAAGVSEAQVAREDITQKSTKTIPLRAAWTCDFTGINSNRNCVEWRRRLRHWRSTYLLRQPSMRKPPRGRWWATQQSCG